MTYVFSILFILNIIDKNWFKLPMIRFSHFDENYNYNESIITKEKIIATQFNAMHYFISFVRQNWNEISKREQEK